MAAKHKRKEVLFSPKDLASIDMAAEISRSNPSAFIRNAAVEKASQILAPEQRTILHRQDWETFMKVIGH